MRRVLVHHFSEDASIERFEPHVPRTNSTHPPAVWAIDTAHAPLYWFPRDCPRVTVWPRNPTERRHYESAFDTTARRLHVIEQRWWEAMASTTLYRYDFDVADFEPWPEASGQWISTRFVTPIDVSPVDDLVARHAEADIELRATSSLFAVADLVRSDRWDFSIVRLANAAPALRERAGTSQESNEPASRS